MQSEEQSYKCDVCSTTFKNSFSVVLHMNTHICNTGLKTFKRLYKCNICFKSFKSKFCLSLHKKLHEKLKCGVCPMEYTDQHVEFDPEKQTYECKVCFEVFRWKGLGWNHIKKHAQEWTAYYSQLDVTQNGISIDDDNSHLNVVKAEPSEISLSRQFELKCENDNKFNDKPEVEIKEENSDDVGDDNNFICEDLKTNFCNVKEIREDVKTEGDDLNKVTGIR